MTTNFVGMDETREWLEQNGFKIYLDNFRSEYNVCNWQAFRRTKLESYDCETNDGNPVQIAITPFKFTSPIGQEDWKGTVEIELVGECDQRWYNIKCYAISVDDLYKDLNIIEQNLINAWNILYRPTLEKNIDE